MSSHGLTPQERGKMSRKAASMMMRKMFIEAGAGSSNTTTKTTTKRRRDSRASSTRTPKMTLPPRKSLHTKSASTLPGIGSHKVKKSNNNGMLKKGEEDPRGPRKSTPSTDPLEYRSNTLPRPQSRPQKNKGENLRWIVDSRVQLEETAGRRGELESRGTIARRMRERKMANNTTSIHWTDKVEYTTDMMRSFADAGKGTPRDPFQDLKRAKALKKQLQKSQIGTEAERARPFEHPQG